MKGENFKIALARTAIHLLNAGGGQHAVSMAEIARSAKITAPTLYHYFKGKNEIFDLSHEVLADDLLALMRQELPQSMDASMRLKMHIVGIMEYLHGNYGAFGSLIGETIFVFGDFTRPPAARKVAEFQERLGVAVRDMLGIEKIDMDPIEATVVLFSLMLGETRFLLSREMEKGELAQRTECVFDLFVDGVRKWRVPHLPQAERTGKGQDLGIRKKPNNIK